MTRKKGIGRLRNVAMAMILTAGTVCPTYAATAESIGTGNSSTSATTGTSNSSSTIGNLLSQAGADHAGSTRPTTPNKEETVYLFAKADGTVHDTIVSDWLQNTQGEKSLQDVSTLSDIKNTEGNQDHTTDADGKKLSWEADGSDIYYQGSTAQAAPVDVKVTYTLDGKAISPDQLAGKSGTVTMRFDYTNHSVTTATIDGAPQTIYTPFVAMTGLVLDNNRFRNVTVTNGKSMNDGDRTTIAGYALPGMQDDLGISKDEIDVPDYFEITADATDFKFDTTATIVSNGIFENMNADSIDASSIQGDIEKLSDSMAQLVNGSSSLYTGLQQLAGGSAALDSGIGQLQDQTGGLPDSSAQLAGGSSALAGGIQSALDGSRQLNDGSSQIGSGLSQLRNGTGTTTGLQDAVGAIGSHTASGTLLYGSNALVDGLQLLRNGNGTPANPGLTGAQAGADQLAAGLTAGRTAFDTAIGSATAPGTLLYGSSSANAAATTAATEAGSAAENDGTIAATLASIDKSSLSADDQAKLEDALARSKTAASDSGTAAAYATGAAAAASQVSDGLSQLQTSTDADLGTAVTGATALSGGLSNAVDSIYNSTSPTQTLLYAAQSVDGGLNVLQNGGTIGSKTSKGLKGAVDAIGSTTTDGTLLYGSQAMTNGLGSLSGGLATASDGANQLAGGTAQLQSAAPALASGIQALKAGSSQLATGSASAASGSLQLSDGLKQFDNEGVQKIVDIYNGNLKGLSSRMKAIAAAGKAYDTFSGKSSDMSGNVKFIYETDSIGNDD